MDYRTTPLVRTGCLAGLFFGAATVGGCVPAPVEPFAAEDETWIDIGVQLNATATPVRLMALPKDGSLHGSSVYAGVTGEHRLGPLPPGDYDVVVYSTDEGYATVHNYPIASVTTAVGSPARADVSQPGEGSVAVGFAGPRPPGTMVTAVTVLDGMQHVDSHATFTELYETGGYWRRSRNTISAENLETTFEGLAPGPYTACATVNLGGVDLRVTCEVFEVVETQTPAVTLDVAALAGRYSA